ncbi:hypothetical protein [Burkholderia sp. LMG 21824]|uniref:hypothetical protein n=1 Tax=Burkholderia sp. LMG 21824 TaxID=3158172 RepID=UPI003C2C6A55
MDTPKVEKHSDPYFDWDGFYQYVNKAYGNIEKPNYSFAREFCDNKKYPRLIEFLEENYQFIEDTEPNTDVSYGYLFKQDRVESILRVSIVGPYFYLSPIISGGGQGVPDVSVGEDDFRLPLLNFMDVHGFVFTSREVLRRKIMFGGSFASVYSIIYCYEDEPLWVVG